MKKLWIFIKSLFSKHTRAELFLYELANRDINYFHDKHPELDPSNPMYDQDEYNRVKKLFMEMIKEYER